MKTRTATALFLIPVFFLTGCGVVGHNVSRLRNSIPNVSSLGNLLRIENDSGDSQPVRIEDGRLQTASEDQ